MSKYVLLKGNKVHYALQGEGKTIVLLHGFMESLGLWKYFTRRLSSAYRVVLIDLPGHGRSDSIQAVNTMELEGSWHYKLPDGGTFNGRLCYARIC